MTNHPKRPRDPNHLAPDGRQRGPSYGRRCAMAPFPDSRKAAGESGGLGAAHVRVDPVVHCMGGRA
jgi:hypothetical protein